MSAPQSPPPPERVRAVTPYNPPRAHTPPTLKLDANEGPPPPAELLDALRTHAETLAFNRYPAAAELTALLAERLRIDTDRVLVTAGADDALGRACMATLEPGRNAIISTPTFEMIPRYVRLAGAELVEIPWKTGSAPIDAYASAVTEHTGAIFLVTPNSPTGLVATADELRTLRARTGAIPLVVDLAYTEFADEDLTPIALELPHTIITRTLSKAWGLAGLRVGYTAGDAELIEHLRTVGHPYAVPTPSLVMATAHVRTNEAWMHERVERVRTERSRLQQQLTSAGLAVTDSQANFVFARTTTPEHAEAIAAHLAEHGIAIRRFTDAHLAGSLRITLPADETAFQTLTAALHTALSEISR